MPTIIRTIDVAIDWDSNGRLFKVLPGVSNAIVFNQHNDGSGVGATFALTSLGVSQLDENVSFDSENEVAYVKDWRLSAVWTELTTGSSAEYVRGEKGTDAKPFVGFSLYMRPDKPSERIGVRLFASFEN